MAAFSIFMFKRLFRGGACVAVRSRLYRTVRELVFSAVCLALCLMLPFLTGQVPQIGGMLCPMHIPVFLAGFLCGPWWAMLVGAAAPSLRYLLFSMPPLLPTGLAMTFELAAYGLASGLLHRLLPKRPVSVYAALVGAMVIGRVVWGAASIAVYAAVGDVFTWQLFAAGAFFNAIPGMLLHLIVVPALVLALKKSTLAS